MLYNISLNLCNNKKTKKTRKHLHRIKNTLPLHSKYRGVEQLVARWAHNPKVIGSSPVSATKSKESLKSGSFFMPSFL